MSYQLKVEQGYVGPIEIIFYDDKQRPRDVSGYTGSIAVYQAPGVLLFSKSLGVGSSPERLRCLLLAGDTAIPNTYYVYGEITSPGGVREPWHGNFVVDGVDYSNAGQASAIVSPLIVDVSQYGGGFASVADALDAITDAEATKPYIIRVAPGRYIEPRLNMKPYVALRGLGSIFDTILVAEDDNDHFINGAPGASMRDLAIEGPLGFSKAAINYEGLGFTPFLVRDVAIRKGYFGLWSHPTAYGTCHAHGVVNHYSGAAMQQFMRVSDHGNLTMMGTAYMNGPPGSVVAGFYAEGANATMTMDLCAFNCAGAVDGLLADAGAHVRLNSCTFHKGTNALHAGPTAGGTVIEAAGCTIDPYFTWDALANAADAVIAFSGGNAHKAKINMAPGAVFTGSFTDRDINSIVMWGMTLANSAATPTVAGSRGGNVALNDLLAKLAELGLIVNNTSA